MSAPLAICIHFRVRTRGNCEAGRIAPQDCRQGCAAYSDGQAFLGVSLSDLERQARWRDGIWTPRATFRGQSTNETW